MPAAQLEDGYTRIANDILEAMAATKLSAIHYRIIFIIWRYTYGFQRKEHAISLQFLATATGYDKRQLQRELKKLEDMKIIYQEVESGKARTIGFNKNTDEWGETIGNSTNGNFTNGNCTNGDDTNTTIGSCTNGAIGNPTNQERNNLKEKSKEIYTPEFEQFWSAYPRCKEKKKAFKAWQARIKGKHPPEVMIRGAKNYALECEQEAREEQFTKLPATFLGPNEHFLEYQEKPKPKGRQIRGEPTPAATAHTMYSENLTVDYDVIDKGKSFIRDLSKTIGKGMPHE